VTSLLSGVSPRDRVGQPLGWRQQQTGDGEQGTVEGKVSKAVESVVLYGPVAGSTAYCQVANTNVLGSLATTEADTVPRTREVSTKVNQNSLEDVVDLQADGTGRPTS
jgi:hypothetical protein